MVVYIIKHRDDNLLVRKGRRVMYCYNPDRAKSFRYQKQALEFIDSLQDSDKWIAVKIERL